MLRTYVNTQHIPFRFVDFLLGHNSDFFPVGFFLSSMFYIQWFFNGFIERLQVEINHISIGNEIFNPLNAKEYYFHSQGEKGLTKVWGHYFSTRDWKYHSFPFKEVKMPYCTTQIEMILHLLLMVDLQVSFLS